MLEPALRLKKKNSKKKTQTRCPTFVLPVDIQHILSVLILIHPREIRSVITKRQIRDTIQRGTAAVV